MNLKIVKYIFLNLLFIFTYHSAFAQTYPVYKKLSAIAVLDQESLFSETEWGKEILKNIENKVTEFAAVNGLIESELELEELTFTLFKYITAKNNFEILANK